MFKEIKRGQLHIIIYWGKYEPVPAEHQFITHCQLRGWISKTEAANWILKDIVANSQKPEAHS